MPATKTDISTAARGLALLLQVIIKPGSDVASRRRGRWSEALSLLKRLSAAAPQHVVLEPSSRPAGTARRSLQGASIAFGTARALGSRRRLQNHFHHGGHGNDDDDHGGFGGFFGGRGGGRGANCTNGTRGGAAAAGAGAANSTGNSNSTSGATTDVLKPNTSNTCGTGPVYAGS